MYQYDSFIYPVDIVAGANVIRFYDGSSTKYATVPPGTYYAYKNAFPADFPLADFPSLYLAIENAMNAVGENTYILETDTPVLSGLKTSSTVSLLRVAGSGSIIVAAAAADFTFPPSLLGLGPGNYPNSGDYVRGRYTRAGVWRPFRRASKKFSGESVEQYTNSGRGAVLQVTRWGRDTVRAFSYQRVPAGAVRSNRNANAKHAEVAGVGINDHGNYFRDFWYSGISTHRKIIAVHDRVEFDAIEIGPSYEILYAAKGNEYANDLEKSFTLQDDGEYYAVEFALTRASGNYLQG